MAEEERVGEGNSNEETHDSSLNTLAEQEEQKADGGQHLESPQSNDDSEEAEENPVTKSPPKSVDEVRKARMDRLRALHLRRVRACQMARYWCKCISVKMIRMKLAS